jgi:hypothetical protein
MTVHVINVVLLNNLQISPKFNWTVVLLVMTPHYLVSGTKMAVFWVVASCGLLQVYRCFGGVCCLSLMMMEAETSVSFYQTTQRYKPEDSRVQKNYTEV